MTDKKRNYKYKKTAVKPFILGKTAVYSKLVAMTKMFPVGLEPTTGRL